eukprot:scaffold9128_cov52-Attheya_sp.AAC.4
MSSHRLHLHRRRYVCTGRRRRLASAMRKRWGDRRWCGCDRGAVMKCASHAVKKRLGMARLTFSSVMSSCHVHSVVGSGSGDIEMSSSEAIVGPLGSLVKSVMGEKPRKGSGWAMSDFLRCANAFLVVRFWKEPRSCQATRYVRGSMVEKRLGRVMVSASGVA